MNENKFPCSAREVFESDREKNNTDTSNLKNQMSNLEQKLNILSQNLANVANATQTTINGFANAVDIQDQKIVNLIYQVDNKNRRDTITDLQNLANRFHFDIRNTTNTSNYNFKLDNIYNQIKNLSQQFQRSLLDIHNEIFINLTTLINSKLKLPKIKVNDVNNYLVTNNLLQNSKIWFCNNKDHNYTLPVFIRNFAHYGYDQKHEPPTDDEIKQSINLMMKLINEGKIK